MVRITKGFVLKIAIFYNFLLFLFVKYYYSALDYEQTREIELHTVNRDIFLDNPVTNWSYSKHNLSEIYGYSWGTRKTFPGVKIKLKTSDGKIILDKIINDFLPKMSSVRKYMNSIQGVLNFGQHSTFQAKPDCGGFLKQWNFEKEILTFMHIGKAGGTSFRRGLMQAPHNQNCTLGFSPPLMQKLASNVTCPGEVPCPCVHHFDWTFMNKMEKRGQQMAPLIMLRDPITRAVSHFYFAKRLPWTKGLRFRNQTLSEYLDDPDSMLNTRDVWQDGQVLYLVFLAMVSRTAQRR